MTTRKMMLAKKGKRGAPLKGVKLEAVRIVRAKNGGPIRTILQMTHGRPVGAFVSLKCGTTFPWDAIDERHFMWISEADFRVRSFLAQPFRMEFFLSDASKLVYFPDIERAVDNDIEICEIKKTAEEAKRTPFYSFKIGLARKVCAIKGWKFRIVSAEDEIHPGPLMDNVRLVRMNRFTMVTAEDYIRLGDAARQSAGRLTWGEAVATLSRRDDPWCKDGRARLCALIVRRHVCVDLSIKLTQASTVMLAEYLPRAAQH
jgi:hypothetical protein